nr:MAG TPA: hypothetical protein [Caudoviricetes sp.]
MGKKKSNRKKDSVFPLFLFPFIAGLIKMALEFILYDGEKSLGIIPTILLYGPALYWGIIFSFRPTINSHNDDEDEYK